MAELDPPIFGAPYQKSLGKERRHALGAHFTDPPEILKVVGPTIVAPWRRRIAEARTAEELTAILRALTTFRVLDPACGSGNFLYVAYRELVRLSTLVLLRLYEEHGAPGREARGAVGIDQLHGIDVDPLAVALAKAELVRAQGPARAEADEALARYRSAADRPLGIEDLDRNLRQGDALLCDWPQVDAIIGNPPYQSKNKSQGELGRRYLNRIRALYPGVPGHADYCVYWFRRAHDELPIGGRAGLVGTSTIRRNRSRAGGLDYIVGNGGTITEAVSTQVWPGDAVVHVSIVNWVKGEAPGPKTLWVQRGDHVDSPWEKYEVPVINAALSPRADVTTAKDLPVNLAPKTTFQGQTPGVTRGNGFVVPAEVAAAWVAADAANEEVLFKYLIGDDLLDDPESASARFLLDFGERDVGAASRYREPFAHVKEHVLPARREAARREQERNREATLDQVRARVNRHHASFLERWWRLSWRREDMLDALGRLPRYIACSRVTRRPVFELVSSRIRPGDALQVFALDDDYSFGILQSDVHWQWFTARCSGLKIDPRYTSESVYGTFPWPQAAGAAQVAEVARAGIALRRLRRATARRERCGLRALYRVLDLARAHPVKEAHAALDAAVRAAYRMKAEADPLELLLDLNHEIAAAQARGASGLVGPGLPPVVAETSAAFRSEDCVDF